MIFIVENCFKQKTITFQFDSILLRCEKKPLIFGVFFEKTLGGNIIKAVPMTKAEWATLRTMVENNTFHMIGCSEIYHLRTF